MKNIQKYERNGKQDISPLVAGVTGVVIGAGVIMGGAVALNNKKNREKVKKTFSDVKNQAMSYMEEMHQKSNKKKESVKVKHTSSKKKVKLITKPLKKSLQKTSKKLSN